jgi:hypothetical protein
LLKALFLTRRFIDKYVSQALQSPEQDSDQLFQSVTDALKAEGITLKTVAEIAKVTDRRIVSRNSFNLDVRIFCRS